MKTIEFKIYSMKNPQIHQDGYVEVPRDENEMPEWFYYDQNGMEQPREFTHHDGIGITQIGATEEQLVELDEFDLAIHRDFVDWVNEVILLSKELDKKTYRKGDIIIKINDGGKLEFNVFNYSSEGEWDSDYYLGFRLFFNQLPVELDEDVYFEDPYTYEQTKVSDILKLSHNMYVVEVPKDYFDVDYDDPYRREVIYAYQEAFEKAYRETLVREVGVFGIASSMLENKFKRENDLKVFNESLIQDFGNQWEDNFIEEDLVKLYHLTDEDVEKAVMDDFEDE